MMQINAAGMNVQNAVTFGTTRPQYSKDGNRTIRGGGGTGNRTAAQGERSVRA